MKTRSRSYDKCNRTGKPGTAALEHLTVTFVNI